MSPRVTAPWSLAAALLVGAAGCGPPLEEVWKLSDFRVLGLRVDPPEPERGADVQVRLVTADVRERPRDVVWLLCSQTLPPGATAGDAGMPAGGGLIPAGGCAPGALQVAMGETVTFHVPAAGGMPDGSGRESLPVFGYACAGGTVDLLALGRGTRVNACTGTGSRGWLFTGQVNVHGPASLDPTAPNTNPEVAQVQLDGAVWAPDGTPPRVPRCTNTARPGDCPGHPLQVTFTPASRQSYHSRDPNSRVVTVEQERITTGFVVSGGRLEGGFRTDSRMEPMSLMDNVWRAPAEPGTYQLVVYAVDSRGGFDSTTRSLQVE